MSNEGDLKIWVDADACPVVIKEILFKASERVGVEMIFVANHALRIPALRTISFLQVASGFDVADNEIVKRMSPGDLVITNDIPLAAEVIEKGGKALSSRGELFSENTIKSKLAMRDFMDNLRGSGIHTGGPGVMHTRDRQAFANHLDQWLTRHFLAKG